MISLDVINFSFSRFLNDNVIPIGHAPETEFQRSRGLGREAVAAEFPVVDVHRRPVRTACVARENSNLLRFIQLARHLRELVVRASAAHYFNAIAYGRNHDFLAARAPHFVLVHRSSYA